MSKKMFTLINSLLTAVSTGAIAFVTYYEPANATAINTAIGVATGAISTICNLFVKTEPETKKE
jgi:hypothetical protein